MFTWFYMINILETHDDTFNSNQVHLIVLSPSSYEIIDIYLSICEEKNIQDLVKLKLSYILIDINDKN